MVLGFIVFVAAYFAALGLAATLGPWAMFGFLAGTAVLVGIAMMKGKVLQ